MDSISLQNTLVGGIMTIQATELLKLYTALEYTRATISGGYEFPSMEGKSDYLLIHKGRASQSIAYLKEAITLINKLKKELK